MTNKEINTIALHYKEHKDEKSFTILHVHFLSQLHHILKGYYPSRTQRDEIVQLVFIKLIEKIDLWDINKSQIGTWLYTVAKNQALKAKKNTQFNYSIDQMLEFGYEPTEDEYTETKYVTIESVYDSIDNLAPMYSEPFLLYISGMTYKDIASKLDWKMQTVKNRICRARKLVKKHTGYESRK